MAEGFSSCESIIEASHSLTPKERRAVEMFRIANLLVNAKQLRKSYLIQQETQKRTSEELPIEDSSELPVSVESLIDTKGSIEV